VHGYDVATILSSNFYSLLLSVIENQKVEPSSSPLAPPKLCRHAHRWCVW